jgi:hypothetical protein
LILAIASYLYWDEHRPTLQSGPPPQVAHVLRGPEPAMAPGIRQPKTFPASQVRLADQAEVIGVAIAGKYRAYALSAFTDPVTQVVNDLIGDVPVTVTYCIKPQRCRVFTSDQRGSPLDVWQANIGADDIVLRVGDVSYSQKLGKPPLKELEAVRTTWKDWKQSHPDTDVYLPLALTQREKPR